MRSGCSGKVAVVTGGAGGIGRALAAALAAEGARVCIADLDQTAVSCVAAEIGSNAFGVVLDVTRRDSIDSMLGTIAERAGGIDILINNAGVFGCEVLPAITESEFDRIFAVNVKGFLFVLQAVAARMIAQGRGGKIVNIASAAGRRGHPVSVVYSASKAAAISLTQSSGQALIRFGINVNAVAPGAIDTAMMTALDEAFAKHLDQEPGEPLRGFSASTPAGRIGTPADLVGAVLFLASNQSDFVVAQTLNVDGGMFTN